MVIRTLFLFLALIPAAAAQAQSRPGIFSDGGAAIRGYDPVAYFTEARPVKGTEQFSHEWRGARWRFSSAANRDRFAADPQKYAPQYGGYCAYGTARGYKAPTEPHAFTIVGGKLYLNYDAAIQDTWREDKAGYISKADQNWPAVKDQ